jgi:agmatine deiminase
MKDTPLKLGYMMPAEWELHSAIWLAWPHDKISFPDLEKTERDVTQIISAIYKYEKVNLLVLDQAMQDHTTEIIQKEGIDLSKINFLIVDYMDAWMRDCGPCFVKNTETGTLAWVKWDYNVYGGKFPDLLIDNEIMYKLEDGINTPMFQPGIVMEGGAFEVNGEGVLITTEQCLLNSNRNPSLNKDQIEIYLKEYLGVTKILWLKQGLVGDHTDGHVDDIARFISKNKILVAFEENQDDENYQVLVDNYNTLSDATDQDGNKFELIKLPMAHIIYDESKPFEKGGKAPASYTNFYIGNSVVLAPTYNDLNDAKALEIIQSCFPDRKVIGIDCTSIIYGGGAIHCMTQQEPII